MRIDRSIPFFSPFARRRIRSRLSWIRSASSSRISPSSVRTSLPRTRWNNSKPRFCSACFSVLLTEDCEIVSSSAAAVIDPFRQIEKNTSIWRKRMGLPMSGLSHQG